MSLSWNQIYLEKKSSENGDRWTFTAKSVFKLEETSCLMVEIMSDEQKVLKAKQVLNYFKMILWLTIDIVDRGMKGTT